MTQLNSYLNSRSSSRQHLSWLAAFVMVLSIVLFIPLAEAQSAKIIYEKITLPELAQLMENEDYEIVPINPSTLYFEVAPEGAAVTLDHTGTHIKFYSYNTEATPSFEQVNNWNRTYRFARSYVDDEGALTFEADFYLRGGVTQENLMAFINTCRSIYMDWLVEFDIAK